MECRKCNSNNIGVRLDKRNIAEFYCEDCGAQLKKASSAELVELINLIPEPPSYEKESNPADRKVPCRYCNEDYFFRMGRMGTQYMLIETNFCPMCGRRRRPEDRGV